MNYIRDYINQDSIGVICRGPSVEHIDKCIDKFDHCFCVSQCRQLLHLLRDEIKCKSIVQFVAQDMKIDMSNYPTDPKVDEIIVGSTYNNLIRNEQLDQFEDFCNSHHVKVNTISSEYTKHYNDRQKRLPAWYASVGSYALNYALWLAKKEVHIIGMDFYYGPQRYYCNEGQEFTNSDPRPFDEHMLHNIAEICVFNPEKTIYLYTIYPNIQSHQNLKVIQVNAK